MYETVGYNEGFFQLNSGYTHGSRTLHPASSSSSLRMKSVAAQSKRF